MKLRFLIPFLLLCCGKVFSSPVIIFQENTEPGGVLRIILAGDTEISSVEAELYNLRGEITASVKGFPYYLGDYQFSAACILGIPSTLDPGEYRVTVLGKYKGRDFSADRPVSIKDRSFLSEEINLNERLSDLRQTTDPRREEESRELWGILSSHRMNAYYNPGVLILPLPESPKSSFFGDRRIFRYSDGGQSRTIHFGIDYAAVRGTPVYAAGNGMVVLADYRIITGNTVVLEHLPGIFSLYYHLDTLSVEKGRYVVQGELLGTVGATGLATGNHLHWEIRIGTVPVDPERFIREPLLDKGLLIVNIE